MKIFPIGTVSAGSSSGTINGVTYTFFEPNKRCKSNPTYNNLVTKFQNQTMLVAKKAEPFLSITYEYDNIFSREYRQIEHFINDNGEGLTSCYMVDFSKAIVPSAVASIGDWYISLDNTKDFSATANMKGSRAFITNGISWKEGQITSITLNASIVVDVDTYGYGSLSSTDAGSKGYVFPMYEVYINQGSIGTFEPTVFVQETINNSSDGGWMYTGNVSANSRYRI